MKRIIQNEESEIICNQCKKVIPNEYPKYPIVLTCSFWNEEMHIPKHFDTAECFIEYLVSHRNEFDRDYYYNISFPIGEYIIDIINEIARR